MKITSELVKIPFQLQKFFPRYDFDGVKATSEWSFELDGLMVQFRKDIWSGKLADESVRWPTTWWDAVKARWFPRWALRRWPAAYSHADFTIYRGYPDIVMPERQSVLFSVRKYDA